LVQSTEQASYHLITGNHEVLTELDYRQFGLQVHAQLHKGPFLFIPDADDLAEDNQCFAITGPIHPAVRLSGRARQSARLPCFFQTERCLVLPAFGQFTGAQAVQPTAEDHIYAIVDEPVLEIATTSD
jgi:metallophosphoesterase superfamily enzyme